MKKIGVLGAGVMGVGVAQAFAEHGFKVILVDITEQILREAKEKIEENVRLNNLLFRERKKIDLALLMENINFTTDYEELKYVDFVVENVPEKWEIKKGVYEKLDKICKENCIFMVNTSCISITKISDLTRRPDKVVGTHFMNPVPINNTVETIKGYHTSEKTLEILEGLLGEINKESIVVNDYPGFVSNRVSHIFMNEAAYLVLENVATPDQVDEIFRKCFGHKMGPLETADLIGLDTVMDSLDVLYDSYKDSKFSCCPLIRKLVYAGRCGRKSGEGFYKYN